MYNVLFYDAENATRSILAEVILNHWGKGKFQAYSAGSHPTGEVNPKAIEALQHAQLPTEGLRSKSIDEFAAESAPQMDFVFTLCDKALNEKLPPWPDHTITASWDIENPNEHDDIDVIHEIIHALDSRINLFMQLPIEKLEHLKIQQAVQDIANVDKG